MLAFAHLYFLARLFSGGDAATDWLGLLRLAGLLVTIALCGAEALGRGPLRKVLAIASPRQAAAFWLIVTLAHAGVPLRMAAQAEAAVPPGNQAGLAVAVATGTELTTFLLMAALFALPLAAFVAVRGASALAAPGVFVARRCETASQPETGRWREVCWMMLAAHLPPPGRVAA